MSETNGTPETEPTADKITASLILYDIPASSKIDNPSGQLRRHAVRINLSCWVCPEHAVPLPLLKELGDAGAVWHVLRFDAAEGPKLVKMVVTALKKEIAENVARGETCLDEAAERHLNNDEISKEARNERYALRAGAIVDRLNELVEDLTVAAKQFGIDPKRLNLAGARRAIEAMDLGWHKRVEVMVKAKKKAKGKKGSTTTAALADADAPAGVLADALQETGEPENESAADELRETFAGVAGQME